MASVNNKKGICPNLTESERMGGYKPKDFTLFGLCKAFSRKALDALEQYLKTGGYKKIPSLEIAIKRFNYAHEHREREDVLIDIFIGLEALYSTEIDELRFKLALRAATFLEAAIPEHNGKKKEIFDVIYEGYKLRSNVVHGKKVSNPKLWEHRIVRRYLADSIKQFAYLSQRHTNKSILVKIDECIKSHSRENLLALFS